MSKSSIVVALLVVLWAGPSHSDRPSGPSEILVAGQDAELVEPGGHRRKLTLTFADEFNTLDRQVDGKGFWRTTYWWGGPGDFGGRTMPHDEQQQLYVTPEYAGAGKKPLGLDPFEIRDGILEITAAKTPPELLETLHGYKYTSGLIHTKDIFEQAYGYYEIRAKLPAGKGLWPAFWLAPADRSWPPEIDVFEMLGQNPSLLYTTVHYVQKNGEGGRFGLELKVEDTSAAFHTYGMSWTPQVIRFFVDRKEVATTPTPEGVHKPMYVLANLGVGGRWPGPADETTPFPATMSIDYIRVYQFTPAPKRPRRSR